MHRVIDFLVRHLMGVTWAAPATVWLSVLAALTAIVLEPLLHIGADDALAVSYIFMGLAIVSALLMVLRTVVLRWVEE